MPGRSTEDWACHTTTQSNTVWVGWGDSCGFLDAVHLLLIWCEARSTNRDDMARGDGHKSRAAGTARTDGLLGRDRAREIGVWGLVECEPVYRVPALWGHSNSPQRRPPSFLSQTSPAPRHCCRTDYLPCTEKGGHCLIDEGTQKEIKYPNRHAERPCPSNLAGLTYLPCWPYWPWKPPKHTGTPRRSTSFFSLRSAATYDFASGGRQAVRSGEVPPSPAPQRLLAAKVLQLHQQCPDASLSCALFLCVSGGGTGTSACQSVVLPRLSLSCIRLGCVAPGNGHDQNTRSGSTVTT